MSEMRRAAASLLERRTERFETRHALEHARGRLADALAGSQHHDLAAFAPQWREEDGKVVMEVTFEPAHGTRMLLQLTSVVFVLLVAASAWVLFSPRDYGALRFLLPLVTVLGILGLPFVTLGLASTRAAREAQARRAIRRALEDETG